MNPEIATSEIRHYLVIPKSGITYEVPKSGITFSTEKHKETINKLSKANLITMRGAKPSEKLRKLLERNRNNQKDILIKAYKRAHCGKEKAPDDSSLVEKLGIKVKIVPSDDENIKITTPVDLALAKTLIKKRK